MHGQPLPYGRGSVSRAAPRALGLLAELTYRCPLHCPYCSNPTEFSATEAELTTAEWERVLGEAGELGVLHVHFSGGEPLLRPDLPELVRSARAAGLYTNLLTSGVGLIPARGEQLQKAGLDSIQISFQADEAEAADTIAGVPAHARKLEAARLVVELGLPLTLNVVLHGGNIDRIEALTVAALDLGGVGGVQPFPWYRLDARTVPQLSRARQGFRRLSLPCRLADRRRGQYGPGM